MFHGGRLFQQWAVDMYVKVDSMRLDWYSKPAQQDRASHAGLRIVLLKDFPGSDLDVHSRFMDAMALVTRNGKPDFL